MNKLKKFIKALYDSISTIFRFSLNLKIVALIYFCQVNSTCLEINESKNSKYSLCKIILLIIILQFSTLINSKEDIVENNSLINTNTLAC